MIRGRAMKSKWLAGSLSIVPGLGHLYTGELKKGIALLVIDIGIIATLIFVDSLLIKTLMLGIYIVTVLPAILETSSGATQKESNTLLNSRGYVVFLLLTTGFSALPLLWQNTKFSRRAKIAWSIAVPVLAVCFFTFLIYYHASLEHSLQRYWR